MRDPRGRAAQPGAWPSRACVPVRAQAHALAGALAAFDHSHNAVAADVLRGCKANLPQSRCDISGSFLFLTGKLGMRMQPSAVTDHMIQNRVDPILKFHCLSTSEFMLL